jgi:hypothetical protein
MSVESGLPAKLVHDDRHDEQNRHREQDPSGYLGDALQ